MLIRFFKNNNPTYFFILPVFAAVFWVVAFMNPTSLDASHSTLLFDVFAKYITAIPLVNIIVSFFLVVSGSFFINFVVNESEIMDRKTFLPALFYIVFMSINRNVLTFHPGIISNLFIIFAVHKIFNAYRKTIAFSEIFDAGLLLSLASLFYFPSILLFPILGFGLIIFRTFHWREWFVAIIGIAVPYCFVLTYYYCNDILKSFWYDKLAYFVYHERPSFEYSTPFYLLLFSGGLIVLFSFSKIANTILLGSQKTKKNLQFIIWVFLFCLGSLFLAPGLSSSYFTVLAVPFTFFSVNYFFHIKKEGWGEILFLLFIISILINDFTKYF